MTNDPPHPFLKNPHRTIVALSIPVLISLVAEPLTGVVDTAFVARLGDVPLAALGVGTSALSSVFWIFSFLGVSAQTGVAHADGNEDSEAARRVVSLALTLAIVFSLALMLLFFPLTGAAARLLGADGTVEALAVRYMRVRLFGTPAILVMLVVFGGLRGRQDMRTPLWIAVGVNLLNILLDYVLIFGFYSIPALDITGAALASTISQYCGAIASLIAIHRRFGLTTDFDWRNARDMIRVGGDLFVRTGSLTILIIVSTRVATQAGSAAGAAHQANRTFFLLSALMLDSFAVTAQSLVGYFFGAQQFAVARRVVSVALWWGMGIGVLWFVIMLVGREYVEVLLVPERARPLFRSAWFVVALAQVPGAAAFVTDGVHMGTGDFRYLRNVMLLASVVAIGWMLLIDPDGSSALWQLWAASLLWTTIRAALGVMRVYPGIGTSPFGMKVSNEYSV